MRFLPLAFLVTLLPAATPPIAVHINVQPSFMDSYQLLTRKTPYTFTCTALAFDAGSKKALVRASVIAERGKTKTEKKTNGEYAIDFTVTINKDGDRADTRVALQRNGVIVTEQRNMTALTQPAPFGRP